MRWTNTHTTGTSTTALACLLLTACGGPALSVSTAGSSGSDGDAWPAPSGSQSPTTERPSSVVTEAGPSDTLTSEASDSPTTSPPWQDGGSETGVTASETGSQLSGDAASADTSTPEANPSQTSAKDATYDSQGDTGITTPDAGRLNTCCRWGGFAPHYARCVVNADGTTSFGCVDPTGVVHADCRDCALDQEWACLAHAWPWWADAGEAGVVEAGAPDAGYSSVVRVCPGDVP